MLGCRELPGSTGDGALQDTWKIPEVEDMEDGKSENKSGLCGWAEGGDDGRV